MKKLSMSLLLIGCVCAFPSTTRAQANCSGVYLTADNYSNGKINSAYTGKNGSRSSDYDLLTKKKILIDQSGTFYEVDKNDIYAVQECDGKVIRIYKGGYYTLMNPGKTMPLYMVMQNQASKGDITVTKYYFSKTSDSEIKELTFDNLENAFPDFHQLDDAMKMIYKTDKEMFTYIFGDNGLPQTPPVIIKSNEK